MNINEIEKFIKEETAEHINDIKRDPWKLAHSIK